jgi:2-polyprenyl-3-methyl-5-hydroxy-6-metoxy-1,4-benzoquinol methylase
VLKREKASKCPVCSHDGFHSFTAKKFRFSKCKDKNCGHVYVDPMPTEGELELFYAKNNSGLENSDSWTMVKDYEFNPEAVQKFYEGNRIKFLRRKRYLNSETAVLDVGCSTGMFLRVLKDQGYNNLVGVDVSAEQVEHCREVNMIPAFRYFGDIPSNLEFDLVSLYAVLEHVANPLDILEQSAKHLKKDGKLIVDVPNFRSIYRFVSRNRWLWLIPPIHLQYFSPRSMKMLAEKAGLNINYSSTRATSTYIFIVAYHIFGFMKRDMPEARLTSSRINAVMLRLAELVIRIALSPISVLMRISSTHNQIIYVFSRKE